MAAEAVARLEEALDGVSGGGKCVGGLDRGAGGVEGIAAKVVAHLEEALDGVSGGGSGRRHFYFYFLIPKPPYLWSFPHQDQMTLFWESPGSNDNPFQAFLKSFKKESFLKGF